LSRRECVASSLLRAKRQTCVRIDIGDGIVVQREESYVNNSGRFKVCAEVNRVTSVKVAARYYFKLRVSGARKTGIRDVVCQSFAHTIRGLRECMATVLSSDRKGNRED
jgi:hypothetical protein